MVDYNNLITPEGVTRTEITGAEKTQLEADRKVIQNSVDTIILNKFQ